LVGLVREADFLGRYDKLVSAIASLGLGAEKSQERNTSYSPLSRWESELLDCDGYAC